jgi:hypothetical protein
MPTAAYPFINITIDAKGLAARARREPGVIAIVGQSDIADTTTPPSTPIVVDSVKDVEDNFGKNNRLSDSLKIALDQDPRASKVYGVKAPGAGAPTGNQYATALASLEGANDVTFVALAGEPVDPAKNGTNATDLLVPLKTHVTNMSDNGNKQIAVAMYNPEVGRSSSYANDLKTRAAPLKNNDPRIVLIAARGATVPGPTAGTTKAADVAAAAMSVIAGLPPHVSAVLKPVNGFSMPVAGQFGPSELKALSLDGTNPVLDPAIIPETGLFLGEGRMFTSNTAQLYVDVVRVLDMLDFRLKAGLIETIGDARITKEGLTTIKIRTEGLLEPLVREQVIASFSVDIPLLEILTLTASARTPGDIEEIRTARENRQVTMLVRIEYGPAVHLLNVTLAPAFT